MDIHALFATDESGVEISGVWRQYGDVEFLIARAGNKKYGDLLGELVTQNKPALDAKGEEANKLSDRLLIEVMAKTILLGWRHRNPEKQVEWKGEPVAYSVSTAQEMLALKDFRRLVAGWSEDMDQYRLKKLEEQQKN